MNYDIILKKALNSDNFPNILIYGKFNIEKKKSY